MRDLIDTTAAVSNFKILKSALTAADLDETLKGRGPFTIFAPNDAAFAKLPKAELDALLADKDRLKSVLTYHLLPGRVMAADVNSMRTGTKVKTVHGGELTIHRKGGTMRLNDSNVTKTDLVSSNGVIHVIDAVMMPAAPTAVASAVPPA